MRKASMTCSNTCRRWQLATTVAVVLLVVGISSRSPPVHEQHNQFTIYFDVAMCGAALSGQRLKLRLAL